MVDSSQYLVLANADDVALHCRLWLHRPADVMSHLSLSTAFWADKERAWTARARNFNPASAASAVRALNELIASSSGSLSHTRVSVEQDGDGLFVWSKSSLRLLRQMGEDAHILDDLGRTSVKSSPVKGVPLPFCPLPPPPKVAIMGTTLATAGWDAGTARPGERLWGPPL